MATAPKHETHNVPSAQLAKGPNKVIIVPPLHPEVLVRRGKEPMPLPAARIAGVSYLQQLYTRGCTEVVNVPADAVVHMPKANLHITKLVVCSNFDPARPHGSCPGGRRCKFVHVMTPITAAVTPSAPAAPQSVSTAGSALRRFGVHVNFAWRRLEDVTYERFPPGRTLYVAAPHDSAPSDVMDAAFALKTKALEQRFLSTLTHCAHYYFNRTCNLGAECRFVHAVFIDPHARPGQRAPPPSAMGRMSLLPSSSATTTASADDGTQRSTPALQYSTPAMPSLCDESSGAPTPPSTPVTAELMSCLSTPRSCSSGCGVDDASCEDLTAVAPAGPSRGPRSSRFRHDPYSPHTSRVAAS